MECTMDARNIFNYTSLVGQKEGELLPEREKWTPDGKTTDNGEKESKHWDGLLSPAFTLNVIFPR